MEEKIKSKKGTKRKREDVQTQYVVKKEKKPKLSIEIKNESKAKKQKIDEGLNEFQKENIFLSKSNEKHNVDNSNKNMNFVKKEKTPKKKVHENIEIENLKNGNTSKDNIRLKNEKEIDHVDKVNKNAKLQKKKILNLDFTKELYLENSLHTRMGNVNDNSSMNKECENNSPDNTRIIKHQMESKHLKNSKCEKILKVCVTRYSELELQNYINTSVDRDAVIKSSDKEKKHKRKLKSIENSSELSLNTTNNINNVHSNNCEENVDINKIKRSPKKVNQNFNKPTMEEFEKNIQNIKINSHKTAELTSQSEEDDIASTSEAYKLDGHDDEQEQDEIDVTSGKGNETIFDEFKDYYDLNIDFFERLENENLQVYWNMPKLHTITKQLIRLPGKDVKQEIKKQNLPLREGHFNSDEDKRIAKNWERLCEKYNLPDTPDVFANWRNGNRNSQCARIRQYIILWLSRKLPDRLPSQVYHRFLHNMGNTSKGRFSETETDIIQTFMSMDSNKRFTQQYLGAILGRDEVSIWRRIKLLKRQNNEGSRKIKWNLDMCENLIFAILSIIFEGEKNTSNIENIMKLRDRPIIWNEWLKIGEKISVPPLSAKIVWNQKLYIQLFSTEPIFKRNIICKLLHRFHEMQYKDWKIIDWKLMTSEFPIFTTTFVFKIFYFFALKECENLMKNFREMIEFLYNKYIVQKSPIKNLKLKRLILNDEKKLTFHPQDVKEKKASV
ncbi:uncharacterized protein LOC143921337 [Arctopsyche grandis]|uniref:uncharacterized protein LOC143921337 n=1 Tax=Arctopsyche grandis TaxID=121162 RepID=UPI00406D8BD6